MENQNGVPLPNQPLSSPQTPSAPPSSPAGSSVHGTTGEKIAIAVTVAILMALVAWGVYATSRGTKEATPPVQEVTSAAETTNNSNKMETTISLLGNSYKRGYTFPAQNGADYSSESYEWVTGAETVENWTTLITTHKLTPLSADKPLSAEAYAQNAAKLNTDNGAVILETSVINTEDAAREGVDITNPPYVLIYIYPSLSDTEPAEFSVQKIENVANGSIAAFIYGERMKISSQKDLDAFLKSPAFLEKRNAVIFAKFPY